MKKLFIIQFLIAIISITCNAQEITVYQSPALKFQSVTTNATPAELGRYQSEDNLVGTITVEVWGVRRGGSRDTIHGIKEVDFKKVAGVLTILRTADIIPIDAKGTISTATFSLAKLNDTGGVVMVTGVGGITIDWFMNVYLKILR